MQTWIWYITLVGCLASACDYGDPICPHSQKTIKWRCPAGQVLVVRASWGRDAGDNSTCLNGVPRENHRTEECVGDDQKALAAVTFWCDANVTPDGDCVFTVPTQKLDIDGEELYDPCPGTQKYLKLCSACECPEPTDVKSTEIFDAPYSVSGITKTTTGDLAMVEFRGEARAGIFNSGIVSVRDLILTDPGELVDIARNGDILFITDYTNEVIHVINENGVYIKRMQTTISNMRRLAVLGDTIWVTTRSSGLNKLTYDAAYNIISSTVLVPNSPQFSHSIGIAVLPSYIVVVCRWSSNIHYLYHNGTEIVPPVSYVGSDASNLELDSCGNAYVAHSPTKQLTRFANFGTDVSTVTLPLIPVGMCWKGDVLIVSQFTAESPKKVAEIEFEYN